MKSRYNRQEPDEVKIVCCCHVQAVASQITDSSIDRLQKRPRARVGDEIFCTLQPLSLYSGCGKPIAALTLLPRKVLKRTTFPGLAKPNIHSESDKTQFQGTAHNIGCFFLPRDPQDRRDTTCIATALEVLFIGQDSPTEPSPLQVSCEFRVFPFPKPIATQGIDIGHYSQKLGRNACEIKRNSSTETVQKYKEYESQIKQISIKIIQIL